MNETMIDEAFKAFEKIDKNLDVDIMEISVKQSQMILNFYDELIIHMSDLENLNELDDKLRVTDVTCYKDQLFVALRDIEGIDSFSDNSVFKPLYDIILILRDLICTCPAVEYVISKEYIKIFLDLPNIKLSDLWKLFEVFKKDPFIEFMSDRPYLLIINENMYVTEEIK